ncbi:MAG: S8 family serine peptidase [Acidimicrobiia bacterium]
MRPAVVAALMGLFVMTASAGASVAVPAADAPQRVIVVLDDTVPNPAAAAAEIAAAHRGQVGFVYSSALKGFSATLPAKAAAAVQRDPRVVSVEPDQVVSLYAQTVPTGIQRIFADDNPNITIDGTDDKRIDVDVAVIDTGIDLDHPDLNVVASTNCSGGSPFKQSCKSGGDDDNGHGTHVAGTIGALDNDFGVVGEAPGARLWSVKVLRSDGSGYLSWIIAGIDYVTANADQIEVANMSLGGEFSSSALDTAIANSVDAGVAYAVAAGNSDKDASTFSPANHPDVLTVSALADFDGEPGGLGSPTCRSDQDDTLADFSNWGSLVEITAPGVCILSTWNDGGYNTISGTSMASPHAAGALALLASVSNPNSDPDVKALYKTLIDNGNFNWTDDSGDGIQEPLLDVSNTTVFAPATVDNAPDTTAPAAPTGLIATAGDTQVDLDWADNAEADLASYNVYRSETSSGSYGYVATTTASAFTDTGLTNGTTYYYVVTAVDTSGNESVYSTEASATPQPAAPATSVHVGDIDGTAKGKGKGWKVSVTVIIHDDNENPVAGATVDGSWSGDLTGTVSGTTDDTGAVTFRTGKVDTSVNTVTFTVDGVAADGLTYDSTANHDPDEDSDGTSITVTR